MEYVASPIWVCLTPLLGVPRDIIISGPRTIQYGPEIIHYVRGNIDIGLELNEPTLRGELIKHRNGAIMILAVSRYTLGKSPIKGDFMVN